MADLFGLLQDLGERIANKGESSSGTQLDDDEDPVEARFRSVLPNLLQTYVVPSKVKEREFTAVLKLLCHTAKNFPGVFYRGKASAVLPVFGQIFPFFAESAYSGRFGVLLEAVGSLITLLKNGDREVYRRLFIESTILLQDLVSVASFFEFATPITSSTTISVKCFAGAFSMVDVDDKQSFCNLPSHWRATDGSGLLLDVTGKVRWQPLAEWTLKFLGRTLVEGMLHVEGLISSTFISAVGCLICFGDSSLQKTGFEFLSKVIPVVDIEVVPAEKLLLTISSILSLDEERAKALRTVAYDSALGSCLSSLFISLQKETVEATAHMIMEVFLPTILNTRSLELKVAMCLSFENILKFCPPAAWKLDDFLQLLFVSDIQSHVCKCLEHALDALKLVSDMKEHDRCPMTLERQDLKMSERLRKRKFESSPEEAAKRQRAEPDVTEVLISQRLNSALCPVLNEHVPAKQFDLISVFEDQKKVSASSFHTQLMHIISLLEPASFKSTGADLNGVFSAFHVLINVFCNHQNSVYYKELIKLTELWISWISCKAKEGTLTLFHLATFLEALERLSFSPDGHHIFHRAETSKGVLELLELPWSLERPAQDSDLQRAKCSALVITSMLKLDDEDFQRLHSHAVNDGDVNVRSKEALLLADVAISSGDRSRRQLLELLGGLCLDHSPQVRESVAHAIGQMACMSRRKTTKLGGSSKSSVKELKPSSDGNSLKCPACGTMEFEKVKDEELEGGLSVGVWKSFFTRLLFEEETQQVQLTFVKSISSILTHASQKDIFQLKKEWLECLDILPSHPHRALRIAFSSQLPSFFHHHVLEGLFANDEACSDTATRELQVLGKLKHALSSTEDPDVLENLLEMVAATVVSASKRQQLFFFSFVLLLEQLDSKYVSVQAISVCLLQKSINIFGFEGDSNGVRLMLEVIQPELFAYLSGRLVSRPRIVENFADAVLGVETGELVRQIVPVVLPKLIIEQQHNNDALHILDALSQHVGTEVPLLLLEWCHKVLSILLLKADGKDLMAALQFYEAQTGSDTREIFSAVLPALLDELIQYIGDTSSEDAIRRSARVPLMIQEVACIVCGSDELPGFLKTHFVGLLNSIDRKMLKVRDVALQKQGLRCIDQLMGMIGCHLTAFVPKIMVLLTRAVQEPAIQFEGLQVWLSFIKKLADVSPSNLKSVASQIVVSVMPCLEGQREIPDHILAAVVKVLEELVLTNRNTLDEQASDLPLLPSLPELESVNTVLQEARGVTLFCDQLRRAAEGLQHESTSVRLMASSELKRVMSSQRKNLMGMLLGESCSDTSVINHLVVSLLQGCVEESRSVTSEKLKLFCAECFGELGAVDSVRLNLKIDGRSRFERSDDDLVFELIDKHLVRVMRAASETDVQDAAALAIQELLKHCGCRAAVLGSSHSSTANKLNHMSKNKAKNSLEAPLSDRGEKLWNRFSEDIKDIITPCLTSKYLLKNANALVPSGTVFRPGMSFRRWMYLWVRRLVLLTTGSRSLIFIACKGILRHDMATLLYLLPYIVLNVVCDGTPEARASVTDEILSVLAEAAKGANENTNKRTAGQAALGNSSHSNLGPSEVSIQAVFTLLDNLAQWLDEGKQETALMQQLEASGSQKGKHRNSKSTGNQDPQVLKVFQHTHVSQLLEAIPKTALAAASFRCQAYARALLYFEAHIRNKSGALNPAAERSGIFEDEDVSFLLGVYGGLDEPDGLTGLSKLHKSLSLQDEVLINVKAGNWAEALTCCEQALQMDPMSVTRHEGVLNCLLNMGHLQALVTHVDGLLLRFPEKKKEWSSWGVQAAWRLGQWGLLDEYVCGAVGEGGQAAVSDSNNAFDISLAKVLLAMHKKDSLAFSKAIIQSRHGLLAPLAAASMESYSRAYPLIIKLHMLHELENFQELFKEGKENEAEDADNMDEKWRELVDSWEDRIKVTQPSLWAREPILALRRLMLTSSNMQIESGKCWLQYAKLCRAAGHYETASRAILEAQSAGVPNAHIELAKLFWVTKKNHRAIAELQQALAKAPGHVLGATRKAALGGLLHVPDQEPCPITESQRIESLDAAKSLLLLARWVHSTGQKQREDVLSMYTRVKELQPKWEKSYFYLAKYCDDLLGDARKRQEEIQEQSIDRNAKQQNAAATAKTRVDDKPWWTMLPDVILFYAKGLHKGHRRLFQALPRLLTLWFEFGSAFFGEALSASAQASVKAQHARVMSIMRGCLKDLPTYQWLTALSQLVSRICHQNEDVVHLVKHIIVAVLQAYPQQSLWTMAAVSKSTVAERCSAAAEILKLAKNGLRQEMNKDLFSQFIALIDQLIRLCFHGGASKARTLTLSSEFSSLKRMMPVGVIMPVQRALTVTLPADGLTNTSYNPFPAGDFSTISGIAEEVEILASLQRPKKVILYGSDGSEHPFLCKPKDDLRKDARMMEFTTTINRLLSKDPKSRRRKLYIRTFAVIPLTEDCGMVEWVLHTRGLRHILQDIYVSCGKFDRQKTNPTIKHIYDQNQGKKSEVEIFKTQILPMFPPIFHKWFLSMFSEPANWFQSRVAYAHTTAVWSMVGHIVGLGDRHGENILFDSTTGDCVHVDFSCLFDKGLQLEKPELVPFRLTQNMVDGLGITGYEGVFSRVCEITLSVLRANRETLMSVLETFIHDPLVEWTKSHKSSGIEVKNPHAQEFSAMEIFEDERSRTLDEVEARKEIQKTLCRFRRGPKKKALQTFMMFKYRTTHTSEWAGEDSLPGFRMLLAISLEHCTPLCNQVDHSRRREWGLRRRVLQPL
ncbi:hypothetical protein GOP47_0022697, partial [Adiantum capillus-veneris]